MYIRTYIPIISVHTFILFLPIYYDIKFILLSYIMTTNYIIIITDYYKSLNYYYILLQKSKLFLYTRLFLL